VQQQICEIHLEWGGFDPPTPCFWGPTKFYLCEKFKNLYLLGGWFGATMTCILLALDRFVEILFPKIAKILFHGKKIYFWLLIPIIYCLWFFFFQLPSFHNTKFSAFYYDPYYGTKGLEGNEKVRDTLKGEGSKIT
jgi:hypothetical protein